MADSAEEFSWTVTSRWRTACLQSSCTSHSSVKRHKRKSAGWLQKKKDWLPGIPQWWNSASRKARALGRDGCGHQHMYNKVGNSFFFKKKRKRKQSAPPIVRKHEWNWKDLRCGGAYLIHCCFQGALFIFHCRCLKRWFWLHVECN